MCRNIKTLFNFEPPASGDEIKAASLQFVRKISGFHTPSKVNEDVFNKSVDEVAIVAKKLIAHLVTTVKPHDREEEAHKAHLRAQQRFGKS